MEGEPTRRDVLKNTLKAAAALGAAAAGMTPAESEARLAALDEKFTKPTYADLEREQIETERLGSELAIEKDAERRQELETLLKAHRKRLQELRAIFNLKTIRPGQ